MIRECTLEEISDGKLYRLNDMVRADCNDCKGCHACCQGMGTSIILDPYDVANLTNHLHVSFESLLTDKIELNVVDGLIYPNLKMQQDLEKCGFLNEDGRCSIHGFRPGICRLFPLGRYYSMEEKEVWYFLQKDQCRNSNRTKVKVDKWVGIPAPKQYEKYVLDWHYFLKDLHKIVDSGVQDDVLKKINMYLLRLFYVSPYESDFYDTFYERLALFQEQLG